MSRGWVNTWAQVFGYSFLCVWTKHVVNSFCGRINYEESMMVRLSVSKREKGRRKRANVMSSQLHSLTHFSDISALTGGAPHLDEVRLWVQWWEIAFWISARWMWGSLPCGMQEGMLTLGRTPPFLHFSICLQDQNPVKKRKKIPKKGRKKKGQSMARTWWSAGWAVQIGMSALRICPPRSHQPP